MGYYEFKESDAFDFARASGIQTKQRGDELQFLHCPYCNGGKNKDKYSFSINLKTGQHKCLRASCSVSGNMISLAKEFEWFSLGSDVESYYQPERKEKYRKFKKTAQIESKPEAIAYLESRGITAATTKTYQITVQKDNPNILVFPFLDGAGQMQFIKYRKTDFDKSKDNNKEWCEKNCKPILFGMYQCNLENKTLVMTEGQIDSLSVAESGIENAVSVPSGKNGFTWVPHCWDWMQQFDTLIVFGDCENGKITLLDEMQKRFRGTVKAVQEVHYKGCKDANEILVKFGKEAVREAVRNSVPLAVKQVKELADVTAVDLFSRPKISTGVKSLDKILSGGIYLGQTVILTGKRGDGKSTFGSQILANALDGGKKVFAYSGELQNYVFKSWIDYQVAGKANVIDRASENGEVNFYIPKEKNERISEWYRGRAYLFDNQSADDDELGELLQIIEKAVQQYGIELVLLDNLMTALDVGMDVDLYRAQSKFVDKLVKMAKRQDIAVILVVHPRKNKATNDDTDEVSGSADITNKVDVVMTYKRGKDLPDDERLLTVSKNRLTGKLAVGDRAITLFYDPASKRVCDNRSDFTKAFGWEKEQDGFMNIEQMEIPFV